MSSLNFSGSPFEGALDACGLKEGTSARIGDEGRSLDLDHQGQDESSGLQIASLHCVLDELEAPDSVISQMEQTRALDGRQEGDWNGIEASWNYHPDTGLDVLLALS
ncbi:hypothetical protein [Nocardiopsis quinghaiensis]|uniref:hypothetical protein n=1 Tax=Nocardiopsis quinghaiensis TaxID=464995 RepID=UPI0012392B40|nr:hypothetical protein [Nocardiopsis quinghaiensis]